MARFDRWPNDTVKGEELRRAQNQISNAMVGAIQDAMRPTWNKGRGMLPDPDPSKLPAGEPAVRGVPVRVIEQMEASERAKEEFAQKKRDWEEFRRKQMEEFQAFRREHPWLLNEQQAWNRFVGKEKAGK